MKIKFHSVIIFAAISAMPVFLAGQTPGGIPAGSSRHAANTKPHNVLVSALRALSAAKIFLGQAPDDPAGDREAALKSVEAALAAVNAQLAKTAPR